MIHLLCEFCRSADNSYFLDFCLLFYMILNSAAICGVQFHFWRALFCAATCGVPRWRRNRFWIFPDCSYRRCNLRRSFSTLACALLRRNLWCATPVWTSAPSAARRPVVTAASHVSIRKGFGHRVFARRCSVESTETRCFTGLHRGARELKPPGDAAIAANVDHGHHFF